MSDFYPPKFFDRLRATTRISAQTVAPLVRDLVQPESVVDVGCGSASWAAAFADLGARVIGCDGAYAEAAGLDIPSDRFVAVDLDRPEACRPDIPGGFDLVVCLEVAEHLPASVAPEMVALLCDLGPVVFFSAAVPGQPGTNHVNCRWPSYWNAHFRGQGYKCLDILRPLFNTDQRVNVWYRQNMVLFIREDRYAAVFARALELGHVARALGRPMNLRHPGSWPSPRPDTTGHDGGTG